MSVLLRRACSAGRKDARPDMGACGYGGLFVRLWRWGMCIWSHMLRLTNRSQMDVAFGACLTYVGDILTERTVEGLAASAYVLRLHLFIHMYPCLMTVRTASATRFLFVSLASTAILPFVKA